MKVPQSADPRRWTRRDGLRQGMAAAASLVVGAALTGCAQATGQRVRPTPVIPTVRLVVGLSYQGAGVYGGVVQKLVDGYIAAHFSAHHRGVEVRTTAAGSGGAGPADPTAPPPDAVATAAAIVTGGGPDVLAGTGYQLPAFVAAKLLLPIDRLVAGAGIDLSDFDAGHLRLLRQSGSLMGLPAFDAPEIVLGNLSMVDSAGLALPDPAWTSEQATTLWSKLSGADGLRHRWGMAFDLQDYFLQLFGGDLMSPDGTRCLLDQPLVLQAANWLVPLYQHGIADVTTTGADGDVRAGTAAFAMAGPGALQTDLLAMQALGGRWDFLPMPVFPAGRRATYNNGDWYAINAVSRQPQELLWELLQLVALDSGLQRLLFSTTFVPPNRRSLWDDWLASVRAAAPVLQSKHLEYFVEAMDYGICNTPFHTQPYACDLILQQWIIRIFLGTVSPTLGLQQATTQINALQAQGSAG